MSNDATMNQNESQVDENISTQSGAETLDNLTSARDFSLCRNGVHGPIITKDASEGHREVGYFSDVVVTHAMFDAFGDTVRQVSWFGDNMNFYDHAVAIADAKETEVLAGIFTDSSHIEEFVKKCLSSRQNRVLLAPTTGQRALTERVNDICAQRKYSEGITRFMSDTYRVIADDLGVLMADPSYYTVTRHPRILASETLIKNEMMRAEVAGVLQLPELPMSMLKSMKNNPIDKNAVAVDVLVAVIRHIFLRMADVMRFVAVNRSKDFRTALWYVRAFIDKKWYGSHHESLSEELLRSEPVQALSRTLNMVRIALDMNADAAPRGAYEDHRKSIERIHRHMSTSKRLKLVAVDETIAAQISHVRIEDTRRNVIGVYVNRAIASSGRVSGIRVMPSPDIDSTLSGEMNRFVVSYDLHDKVSPLGAAIQAAFITEKEEEGALYLIRDALIAEYVTQKSEGGDFAPKAILHNLLIDFDYSKLDEDVAQAIVEETLTLYLLSLQTKLGTSIIRAGVASTTAHGPRFIAFEILAERGRYTPKSQVIVGDYYKVSSVTEALLMLPDQGASAKALVGDDYIGESWFNRQIRIKPSALENIYSAPAYLRSPMGNFTYELQVERAFARNPDILEDGAVHTIRITKSVPTLLGVDDDVHERWDYLGVGYYGLMAARSCIDTWMRLYHQPAWANPQQGGVVDNVAYAQTNRAAAQLAHMLSTFMDNSVCAEVASRMASLIKYEQETAVMLDYETVTGASEFMRQLKLQAAVCMMVYVGVFGEDRDEGKAYATDLVRAIMNSAMWNSLLHGERRVN